MNQRKAYKTRNVVRESGFSADLLRAWELRYGLLAPERSAGGHRLYLEDDLRVLRRIRARLDEGQTIGEIARVGRTHLLAEDLVIATRAAEDPPAAATPVTAQVMAADRLNGLRTVLIQATLAMDRPALERAFAEAFAVYAPEMVIHQVLEPVAFTIGDLWAEGQCTVAAEHFFSQYFAHQLRKLIEIRQAGTVSGPTVLCACLPDEQHEIGLLTVAYHLIRQGCQLLYLGPCVPLPALEWACDSAHPHAVCLSVSQKENLRLCHRRLLRVLERHAPRIRFFLGGRGLGARTDFLAVAGGRAWPSTKPLSELGAELLRDQEIVSSEV